MSLRPMENAATIVGLLTSSGLVDEALGGEVVCPVLRDLDFRAHVTEANTTMDNIRQSLMLEYICVIRPGNTCRLPRTRQRLGVCLGIDHACMRPKLVRAELDGCVVLSVVAQGNRSVTAISTT